MLVVVVEPLPATPFEGDPPQAASDTATRTSTTTRGPAERHHRTVRLLPSGSCPVGIDRPPFLTVVATSAKRFVQPGLLQECNRRLTSTADAMDTSAVLFATPILWAARRCVCSARNAAAVELDRSRRRSAAAEGVHAGLLSAQFGRALEPGLLGLMALPRFSESLPLTDASGKSGKPFALTHLEYFKSSAELGCSPARPPCNADTASCRQVRQYWPGPVSPCPPLFVPLYSPGIAGFRSMSINLLAVTTGSA